MLLSLQKSGVIKRCYIGIYSIALEQLPNNSVFFGVTTNDKRVILIKGTRTSCNEIVPSVQRGDAYNKYLRAIQFKVI